MKEIVRVAAGQGFWGDWLEAPRRQVEGGPVDYLMLDYLAEVTMSILQKQKERDPAMGYARDFVGAMESVMHAVADKGVKVTKVQAGATAHIDQDLEKKGVGVGVNDGKVGVANGDAYGGSVTTPDSVKKAGASSSSSSSSPASDGTSGHAAPLPPYKDPVPDSLHFYKLTTPPQRQINDLGPSTNDGARFGDDLAQRV